jgi:hypothetical protein
MEEEPTTQQKWRQKESNITELDGKNSHNF